MCEPSHGAHPRGQRAALQAPSTCPRACVPHWLPRDLKPRSPGTSTKLAHLQQMCGEAGGTPAPGLTGKHAAGPRVGRAWLGGQGPAYPPELCLSTVFPSEATLEKPTPSPPSTARRPLAYPIATTSSPCGTTFCPLPITRQLGGLRTHVRHGGQPAGAPLDAVQRWLLGPTSGQGLGAVQWLKPEQQ